MAGELVVISDGERAIRYIQALPTPADCPDLLILDLNLPRKPGREVLRATRQSSACAGAAIAILSSSDAKQDRLDAMAFGADRYIRKPLRLEEFLKLGGIFKEMLKAPGGDPD